MFHHFNSNRYIAILYPLKESTSWFKLHRNWIVYIVWFIGLIIGGSQLFVSETGTFIHNGNQYSSCGERWLPESVAGQLYTVFIFGATFAVPMIILCVLYTVMACRIIRYRAPGQQQQQAANHNNTNKTTSRPIYDTLPGRGNANFPFFIFKSLFY